MGTIIRWDAKNDDGSQPAMCCPMVHNGDQYGHNGPYVVRVKGCTYNDDKGIFANQPYDVLYSGDCCTGDNCWVVSTEQYWPFLKFLKIWYLLIFISHRLIYNLLIMKFPNKNTNVLLCFYLCFQQFTQNRSVLKRLCLELGTLTVRVWLRVMFFGVCVFF